MRILVAGDAHGNNRYMSELILKFAPRNAVDVIFQVGDFGFWPHWTRTGQWTMANFIRDKDDGQVYLDRIEKKLAQVGMSMYFLDGNHDNHPVLWELPANEDGFVPVREGLFYCPRGHRWTWGGLKCLSLGGAYSVDKEDRLEEEKITGPRTQYWPTETITDDQVVRAKAGGLADIMFTHDCPWGVEIPGIGARAKDLFWQSVRNREHLLDVVRTVRPRRLFHGHYHVPVREELIFSYARGTHLDWWRTEVFGLSYEGKVGSWMVVELSDSKR